MPDNEVIVYRNLHRDGAHAGMKVERAMALMLETQMEMASKANQAQGIASAVLGAHHDRGDSRITVTQGKKVDMFVNLDDERGAHAAYAIEQGVPGRSQGVYALAAAMAKLALG